MSMELDLDNLKMLKELLGDRFDELIETYLTDSVERVAAIKSALVTWDLDSVTHEAHGLKGSSRNIGANPLADLCEIMEKQSRENELQNGQQQLAAIEQKLAAVSDSLKSLL